MASIEAVEKLSLYLTTSSCLRILYRWLGGRLRVVYSLTPILQNGELWVPW